MEVPSHSCMGSFVSLFNNKVKCLYFSGCREISLADFPSHVEKLSRNQNRGFSDEYESLALVGIEHTQDAALLDENMEKNRFTNVLPYDRSRVKLGGNLDYINASYMAGFNSPREYIATQGPLPSTVSDFWKMIWEQKVNTVVMVTNCKEGIRTKCELYWPEHGKSCQHVRLTVTTMSEQQDKSWTLREFRVKHKNSSEERTVKHFHFTAWPDHGVPHCTDVLIQFRGLIRQHMDASRTKAPAVVHCRSGQDRHTYSLRYFTSTAAQGQGSQHQCSRTQHENAAPTYGAN
ncbi:receptor-type tyrosine-protein phosphatase H-like isoform X2 [Stigmatopora nigra]